MNINALSSRQRGELAQRIQARKYEVAEDGRLFVPNMGLFIGGSFRHFLNGEDPAIEANLFTIEGRTNLLETYFNGGAATATWYLAPFSGNVTPLETWTASGAGSTPVFATAATEFTNYSQATRVVWNPNTAASASIGNTGALSVFTINGAGGNIYGMGLLSVSTKSAVTGMLAAAALFDNPRLGLIAADALSIEYIIAATND